MPATASTRELSREGREGTTKDYPTAPLGHDASSGPRARHSPLCPARSGVPSVPQPRQPFLHDLVTVFAAPTQVLSSRTGDLRADTGRPSAEGVLHADVRVLSRVTIEVDGEPGEHIATEAGTR